MWMDINTLSLKLEILKDIPTHETSSETNQQTNLRLSKTNDDRRLTYFYVKCDSLIVSPLVEPPKATKLLIQICCYYTNVKK